MPLGTEVDLGAGHTVLDGFPALRERGTAPSHLGACLWWPRSPISATAELLFSFFGKTIPQGSRGIFPNSAPKGFIAIPIDVFCSNFVKFVRREISQIVRCVPEKDKNFAWLSRSRYCVDRAQNLPGPPPTMCSECSRFHQNRLTFGGVIPESVNTIKTGRSVSNIRLKPSFEPNNENSY